ncbi:glyoxalase [Flavobacteriaceae bacterium]|nr:glyoxalase [Flavobacteriaceae bacterium]
MNKKERPIIKDLVKKHTTEIESFQNTIVRPIIKMQHPLLVASFKNYLEKRKVDLQSCSDLEINNKIKLIYNNDISYRNISLGLIIGHFSTSEFSYYINYSSEINKRIIKIIHQRVHNSLSEIFGLESL